MTKACELYQGDQKGGGGRWDNLASDFSTWKHKRQVVTKLYWLSKATQQIQQNYMQF